MAAQKKFQEYEERALEVMVEILNDDEADHAVRLKAANDIWNRSRGTPVSVSVNHQIQEREQSSPISTDQISSAGTKELAQLAAALSRYVEDEKNTIDVTPDLPPHYPDQNNQE
jgi:mRNA-degrading endonuclease toxin of MazEF toxin-antitoxin module